MLELRINEDSDNTLDIFAVTAEFADEKIGYYDHKYDSISLDAPITAEELNSLTYLINNQLGHSDSLPASMQDLV